MKRWFTLLLVLALLGTPIVGAFTALADEDLADF